MATTSLWHIKGSLKDLIDYVENPDKTVSDKGVNDFFQVFSYVRNPKKTEQEQYVSAINCLKETALQQIILTKKQYAKTDKYIAWHGYQSFKPGEITPEKCHEISVRLAQEMWGDKYQIIVSTHLDQEHLHNYFCFNSVSFLDGKKYNYSKSEQQRLRDTSDKLWREYGVSVIDRPKKAPSRPLYLDEKSGKPTRYNVYREDIQVALNNAFTWSTFRQELERKGYIVDLTGVHLKLKLPQYKYFTRMDTLNPSWTPEGIRNELLKNPMPKYTEFITISPYTPRRLTFFVVRKKRISYLRRTYLFWCYQLGYLPKKKHYRPMSPFLREECRKIETYSQELRYMFRNKINTMDDLIADRTAIQEKMSDLIEQRTALNNKIRRAKSEEKELLRMQKCELTAKITAYRKCLRTNESIETHSKTIDEKLNLLIETERQHDHRGRKTRQIQEYGR